MLDRFYFNHGKCFSDYGLIVTSPITFPVSNEEVEDITVEGKSGTLTLRKGTYPNKIIEVQVYLKSSIDMWNKIRRIEEWLTDIKDNRLIFSDRDIAYRVKRVELGDISNRLFKSGETTFKFICEPFLTLLKEDEIDITNIPSLRYLGNIPGECLIKIYGSGNIQLTVNQDTLTILNVDTVVTIDSKLMQTRDKNNQSKDMTGDYPLLIPGVNTFSKIGTISKITLLPRTQFKN